MSKARPWERQSGEGPKQYASFVAYRDMPPSKRSIYGAWKGLTGSTRTAPKGKKNTAPGYMTKRASEFNWTERAAAWDAHLVALRDEVTEKTLAEAQADHTKRVAQISGLALDQVEKVLKVGFVTEVKDEDGKVVDYKINGTPSSIARLLEAADKAGRLALGMATDRTEISGPDGGPVEVKRAKEELRSRLLARLKDKQKGTIGG